MLTDRFAEKYYSLSPNQYAANNPVKNIDVNGDSIFVQIITDVKTRETQKFYYGEVDGKYGLVGTYGKLYTGTAGDFGNQIAGAMDHILYVNPGADQSAPTEKGSQRLPFDITLGHELAHGLANVQGVQFKDWTTIPTESGDRTLSQSEIYATHIENNLRAEQGLPLRTYYSQDATGTPVDDTRILDSKYRSLYYKQGLPIHKIIVIPNKFQWLIVIYTESQKINPMKIEKFIFISLAFLLSSNCFRIDGRKISAIDVINAAHQKRAAIQNEYRSYDNRVYAIRKKAVRLFGIEKLADISKLKRFVVMDMVNFEGGKPIYGEMVINDTSKFFYKTPFLSKVVEKYPYPIQGEKIILEYLMAHRFNELETLAKEKEKSLSGSNFIYIGMYEKGMDSVYVQLLPAFMMN